MRKLVVKAVAIALALAAILPGISAAKLASNHNRTLLRVVAIALALAAILPGISAAKLASNHNRTLLG